jgi:AraC-like DNA-binding protein
MADDLEILCNLLLKHARGTHSPTAIPRVRLMRRDAPTELVPMVFDSALCLVLQGVKHMLIGDKMLSYGAGMHFISTIETPALGRIAEASMDAPYLSMSIAIDPALIASILLDMPPQAELPLKRGFVAELSGAQMLEAWRRLLELLERPDDIAVLGPAREREILYRLLQGPQGVVLRQIAGADARLVHIRQAVDWLREHYTAPLRVEDLARRVGMSPSVFHRHFKAVTALSPIQYQKRLRLYEARRRLMARPGDAAGAAFAVGYESASQFSREYARLFGAPPARDVARLRRGAEDALTPA